MLIGVIIKSGLQDWQIIQQKAAKDVDGCKVTPWTLCEMQQDRKWQITLKGIPAGGLYRVET